MLSLRQHRYDQTSLKRTSHLIPALAFVIVILAATPGNGQSNPSFFDLSSWTINVHRCFSPDPVSDNSR